MSNIAKAIRHVADENETLNQELANWRLLASIEAVALGLACLFLIGGSL